jgi:hypothetical protein
MEPNGMKSLYTQAVCATECHQKQRMRGQFVKLMLTQALGVTKLKKYIRGMILVTLC